MGRVIVSAQPAKSTITITNTSTSTVTGLSLSETALNTARTESSAVSTYIVNSGSDGSSGNFGNAMMSPARTCTDQSILPFSTAIVTATATTTATTTVTATIIATSTTTATTAHVSSVNSTMSKISNIVFSKSALSTHTGSFLMSKIEKKEDSKDESAYDLLHSFLGQAKEQFSHDVSEHCAF